MAERSEWQRRVATAVKAIPRGQTASYARVALMAGKPGAARQVVRALHELDDVPWWRVVKSDGTVAKEMVSKQAPRLRAEGVLVSGRRIERGVTASREGDGASRTAASSRAVRRSTASRAGRHLAARAAASRRGRSRSGEARE